ncbi:MAG: type II toxin-antitoxin system RelE/ParE family toxin [Candidatus Riflebacteria bacterium]|nr:type II toxin-antitoxin system RelE/ParE family toxin [Candidatus Riflebacteria bacterium]
MAERIVWTEPAIQDLRDAFSHIKRDSETNAAITIGEIVTSAGQAAEFPFSGKISPAQRQSPDSMA